MFGARRTKPGSGNACWKEKVKKDMMLTDRVNPFTSHSEKPASHTLDASARFTALSSQNVILWISAPGILSVFNVRCAPTEAKKTPPSRKQRGKMGS